MYKAILFTLLILAVNSTKAQVSLKAQNKSRSFLELSQSPLSKTEIKRMKQMKEKWDSVKKNAPATPVSLVGQENAMDANVPPVVLPSPNSASLLNIISDDVDLYTGKTSINLPLYTLKCGNISLPIALQGNVNAHKVNDIGSWVGLGMNLNAGGVISRVMKNLPDEFTGNICAAFNIPGWGYINIKPNQGINLSNFDNYSAQDKLYIIDRGNWNNKNSVPDRGWDLQPDEFFFNFGNYSGKFVFDQDGGINLIPKSNLKITPSFQVLSGNNKIIGFTVLDENGFKYEFGTLPGGNYVNSPVEETKLTVNSSSILYSYRAIAHDPNYLPTLVFVYAGGIPLFHPGIEYYAYEREPYLIGAVPGYGGNIAGNPETSCCLPNFSAPENNDNTEYFNYPSTWMLVKLTSPTGDFINFNYSSAINQTYLADRSFSASVPDLAEDVISTSNGNKMMFISPAEPLWDPIRKIFLLRSKQNFTITKSTISLTTKKLTSITTSDNTTISFNSITPREDLPNDNRLDNIVIDNSAGNTFKKINFNYNIVNTSVSDLPDEQYNFFYHTSRYWYSNAMPPQFQGMHSNFVLPNNQIAMTEEIKNSEWAVPADCRKRMYLISVQEEGNGVVTPPYTFEYDNTSKLPFRTSVDQDYYGYANVNSSKHPFISNAGNNMLYYSYPNPYPPPYNYISAPLPAQGVFGSPFPILHFKTMNSSGGWPATALYAGIKAPSVAAMKAGVLNKITYPTGGYKKFTFDFNGNAFAWNGLRVSKIEEFESPTALPIVKNYTYGTFYNTDAPVFNYNMVENGIIDLSTNILSFPTWRFFYSSNRVNPDALTKGTTGGYDFAEISIPNNGKTKVEFFTTNDFQDLSNPTKIIHELLNPPVYIAPANYPYPPKTSYDWKRGLPKKETTFTQSGLTLKSTEYFYPTSPSLFGLSTTPSYSVTRYTVTSLFGNPPASLSVRLFGANSHLSSWHPQTKVISRAYEQNGTNYTESIDEFDYRKYTYSNIEYLLPYQQKSLKNSRNEQTISYSKFPLDYNLANTNDPFIQGMAYLISKNILNAKIEQFSYKQDQNGNNKKYIGGLLNKYHPDKPVPKEIFKLKTNGLLSSFTESNTNSGSFSFDPHYNSEVNFPLYDANGRILEQHKTNDITEAYIWDYGKAFPVAKAVNANNNDIAFSSFEADESGANMTITPANIITDPAGAFNGRKYYNLTYPSTWFPPQPISININNPGKEYRINFWYKVPSAPQPNVPPIVMHTWNGNVETMTPFATTVKSRNGWHYCEYIIPASYTGTLTIIKGYSEPVTYIDDIRFYPAQSQMTTYTFDPLIGMTSETDVNGKTTYYEYDALNRLAYVKNENKDIVKAVCYNYAGQPTPCSVNIDPCASTPRPVINSVTKTGSSGSNFIYSLDFTPSPNSTSCVIELTDITDQTVTLIPISCTSPATFQIPKFHQFSIVVISYTGVCPGGIRSLPYP